MPALGAGTLNERVTFQKLTTTSDGAGGSTAAWVDQFTVWTGVTLPRLAGRMEEITAGAVQSAVAAELIVRDTADTRKITKEWRAVQSTDVTVSPDTKEVWNIRKVYPRERDGFIRMQAEARVPV